MIEKTAAIVVTYNRKELLRRCLDALCAQTEADALDILVIDNASTDGTFASLEELIEGRRILYFNTGENLGGAGGFHYGIRKAYELGYAFFWLMDDDTIPEKDALEELLKADRALGGAYGFLSSAAYWKDGSLCSMNIQRRTILKKQTDFSSPCVPIVMATFVSFFMKREIAARFGLPIREFFIWSDDLEYSRRISRELPAYLVPGSRVLHAIESNEKVGIERPLGFSRDGIRVALPEGRETFRSLAIGGRAVAGAIQSYRHALEIARKMPEPRQRHVARESPADEPGQLGRDVLDGFVGEMGVDFKPSGNFRRFRQCVHG